MVYSLNGSEKSGFDDFPLPSRATSIFIRCASSVRSPLCFSLNELQMAFIASVK
jgi:hypothetical protein